MTKDVGIVLACAGIGQRFGKKKQFEYLGNKPLFMYALETALKLTKNVVLVLPSEDISLFNLDICVVEGGKTRQESVYKGLIALKGVKTVLIHDCVRPFASLELFRRVCNLGDFDGLIPALPINQTVKKVLNSKVIETIDRDGLWLSQTPQGFRYDILLSCHERSKNLSLTDDASLLEKHGYNVGIINGEVYNIKITTLEDMEIARAILKANGRRT
ncbi:MAG: 2-C-methyl-D-erythritol 4-phosphate cytidylyltransferase [Aquificaceae bacterium]|nr:2-C-methyl-D-erythritol 4-phosphate cytidylyltransferase [Aquificaceae bacterium]MDW8237611.1 2-C-methyl-D-erythritol 4-phosphate cytidylyltransferase [Aquificaceae bacterium]